MPFAVAGFGLAILLTAFVAYGYAGMVHQHSTGWLGWVVTQAKNTAKAALWLAEQTVPLTKWILHELGQAFAATYKQAGAWVAGLDQYVNLMAQTMEDIASGMTHAIGHLILVYIPRVIHAIPHLAQSVVHSVTKRVVTVERTIVKVPKLTKALIAAAIAATIPGTLLRDIPYLEWLRKHLKALEHAAAGAVLGVPRALHDIRARLRRLEKLTAAGVGIGVVTYALSRLGLNWIRCNNWKRVGREVCRADPSLITELFGLGVLAAVAVDFRQIVKLAQDVEHVTAKGIHDVLNA